jgi:hypothetical protein
LKSIFKADGLKFRRLSDWFASTSVADSILSPLERVSVVGVASEWWRGALASSDSEIGILGEDRNRTEVEGQSSPEECDGEVAEAASDEV